MLRQKFFNQKIAVVVMSLSMGTALGFSLSHFSQPGALHVDSIKEQVAQYTKDKIKPDQVSPTPVKNLFEIKVGNEISYVDGSGRYIFIDNHLIDLGGEQPKDLTLDRIADLKRIKFDDLPLDKAIKTVIGNGKKRLAIFEDPYCPHCHALRKTMAELTDVTIYSFPVSYQRNDGFQLIESSYCSSNPSQTWLNVMAQTPPPLQAGCNPPIKEIGELANKLNINGTPTIFLENGERIDGFVPLNEWQHKLASK